MDISATFAPAFQETESLEIDILTETDTELQQISLLLLLFQPRITLLKRNLKKNFRNIWKLSDKVLTFAPAFVEKQFKNWLADGNGAKNVFFFFYLPFDKRDDEKKKKEKTSEIIWSIYLKVITFASAFWKEKQFKKKRSLKNLHKQYK